MAVDDQGVVTGSEPQRAAKISKTNEQWPEAHSVADAIAEAGASLRKRQLQSSAVFA